VSTLQHSVSKRPSDGPTAPPALDASGAPSIDAAALAAREAEPTAPPAAGAGALPSNGGWGSAAVRDSARASGGADGTATAATTATAAATRPNATGKAKGKASGEKPKSYSDGLECSAATMANLQRMQMVLWLKKRSATKGGPQTSAIRTPHGRILHGKLFDRAVYEQQMALYDQTSDETILSAAAAKAEITEAWPDAGEHALTTVQAYIDRLALPEMPYAEFISATKSSDAFEKYYDALPANERRLIRMNWHVIDMRAESEMQGEPRNGLIGAVWCKVVYEAPSNGEVQLEYAQPHLHQLALTKKHMQDLIAEEAKLASAYQHMAKGSLKDTLRKASFISGQNALAENFADKKIDGMVLVALTQRVGNGDATRTATAAAAAPAPAPVPQPPTMSQTRLRLDVLPQPDAASAPAAAPASASTPAPAPVPAPAPAPAPLPPALALTPAPAPTAPERAQNGKRKCEYELSREVIIPGGKAVHALGKMILEDLKDELPNGDQYARCKRVKATLQFFAE